MYDVTLGEYIYSTPQRYSIDTCTNTTKLSQLGINDEGTMTNIFTLTDFDGYGNSQGTENVAIAFVWHAKEILERTGEYHTLALCTTRSTTDYTLIWNHSSPTVLQVSADNDVTILENVIPWDESAPSIYSYRFHMFTSTNSIDVLLEDTSLVWLGSYTPNDSTGMVDTYLSYMALTVSVKDQSYLTYYAGEYLGTAHSTSTSERSYYKYANGTAIVVWRILSVSGSSPLTIVPAISANRNLLPGWDGRFAPDQTGSSAEAWKQFFDIYWGIRGDAWGGYYGVTHYETPLHVYTATGNTSWTIFPQVLEDAGVEITKRTRVLGLYLLGVITPAPQEPDTDVDPEDIPPEDEPPAPIPPDDQDPYYDPTSDPDNPEYDPSKDPDNPEYDPTEPHTPFRPPSTPSEPIEQEEQPPIDPILPPETPPSYVTTNAMFTLYNPSGGDLTNLADFLWSPTWSIDTFKKIFANPLDCILGLMVMPHLNAPVSTKTMNVGNISTGVTMHYFTKQFYDFDCGTFELMEYYNSYLDYAPYTKVDIFLPYIGDKQLSTDEVMNKTLGVKYRFDLATGDCIAFITVDGSTLYQFSGNCAARLPLAGNNWNGIIPAITGVAISAGSMAAGLPALGAASAAAVSTMKETISHTGSISGSAGLMGIQTPYLIVTRPRQALPLSQNSFTGYPSFITESLGSLKGYTEVEQCHLEHVPATGAELEEIERLLKEGVLF